MSVTVTAKAKASRKSSQTDLAEQDRSRSRLVETAIYRRARGYKVALKKTHKLKHVQYDPTTGKKVAEWEELATGFEEEHVPADIRAGSYWLCNRDAERWSEHPDGAGHEDGEGTSYIVEMPATEKLDPPEETEAP